MIVAVFHPQAFYGIHPQLFDMEKCITIAISKVRAIYQFLHMWRECYLPMASIACEREQLLVLRVV